MTSFGVAVSLAIAIGAGAERSDACWWLFDRPAGPPTAKPSDAPGDSLADWEQAYRQSPFPDRRPHGAHPNPIQAKAAPFNEDALRLRARLDAAIALGERSELCGWSTPPWEVLHAVIAFGKDAELLDPQTGRRRSAVKHLCEEMTWNGLPVFCPAPGGIAVYQAEKHPHQFLAKLSCAGVPLTQTVMIAGSRHTIAELLAAAKLSSTTEGEVSWTLLAMCSNLPIDATWTNSQGRTLDISTLLAAELKVVPDSAACGGTHGLHAVSLALRKAREAKVPSTETWRRAGRREDEYKAKARKGQNPDGSFSENRFGPPAMPRDGISLIHSTGHVLEWLMLCQSDDEVRQPWVARAANRLADCLIENQGKTGNQASRCHALHALNLYRRRALDPLR